MKGLVLSGGAGTRLRPFSYAMPKQLMPVANQPVLGRVLTNLRDLGVVEVAVVVGDQAGEIQAALGDGSAYRVRLHYLHQAEPRGLADCVRLAEDFLGDDDFVMYLGDNVLPEGVTEIAEEFRAGRPAAQVVVHKVAEPQAFGVAEVDSDNRVTRFVEKPREPRSDLAVIGVYFLTPAIHAAVAAIRPSARGELEITDALQWLVEQGRDVRVRVYSGYWKDTGTVEDLLDCNRELLESLHPEVAGEVDDASELVGPVAVAAGARVIRSRITGPAMIGADTVVRDCQIGPHTAIGAGCVLSGAGVEYSIVLDGAQIDRVRPIHGSVIGRSAQVTTGVGRYRLLVGDQVSVAVAAAL